MSNLRKIKLFPNYLISKNGDVFAINYHRENRTNKMKPSIDKDGYLCVGLRKNGKQYRRHIHRLVAETYIQNPDNLPVVNHKNGVKDDNRVCNLRWTDRKGNCNNPNTIKKHINGKNSKQILQYTISGEFVREWPSSSECDRNGFDNSSVIKCCRGKLKQFKGFKWKYKERVV